LERARESVAGAKGLALTMTKALLGTTPNLCGTHRSTVRSGDTMSPLDAALPPSERSNSMQKITPFLWFGNKAEEAARFYLSERVWKPALPGFTR
jgi:hypothetical protein